MASFVASSAARFKVVSNFSTCPLNPRFNAFSFTLIASGGKGKRMVGLPKKPSRTDVNETEFLPQFYFKRTSILCLISYLLSCF